MSKALPLCKLMILYMLNEVNVPLTGSHIIECLVQYRYATYFEVQQTCTELSAGGLIAAETIHHTTRYQITGEGKQTLEYYHHLIPDSFIANIAAYLKEHKIEFRKKASVIAGYTKVKNGDYAVQLRIIEKSSSIFDMTLSAPSQEIAEQICFNWENNYMELYTHLASELLKTNAPDKT